MEKHTAKELPTAARFTSLSKIHVSNPRRLFSSSSFFAMFGAGAMVLQGPVYSCTIICLPEPHGH